MVLGQPKANTVKVPEYVPATRPAGMVIGRFPDVPDIVASVTFEMPDAQVILY